MTIQTAPVLLPTPSIPLRTSYPIRTNQLKRDKRRRNRRALYQELQELVLGNVHVRVRSDGRVHPFYDKITLRLSPTILQDERYNYLIECLVPKPRQQGNGTDQRLEVPNNNPTATSQRDALEKEQVVTSHEGTTNAKSQPSMQAMEVDETRMTSPTPSQDGGQGIHGVEIAAVPELNSASPSHGTKLVNSSTNRASKDEDDMAKEAENNVAKDTLMCGTMTTRTEQIHHENWVPPPVEKEFSYPSDEEIIPNPKTSFSKDFLNTDKVRGWFKGSEKEKINVDASSSSTAPCLPITHEYSLSPESPQYSHCYVLLSFRKTRCCFNNI
jgi:hypothetical protein